MKKLLAWGMAVVLCLGLLPLGSLASEEAEDVSEDAVEAENIAIEESFSEEYDAEFETAVEVETDAEKNSVLEEDVEVQVEEDASDLWLDGIGNYGVNLDSSAYKTDNPFYNKGFSGQCTWYAWGRAYEKTGEYLYWGNGTYGNAKYWYGNARDAGYNCDTTPSANSIAVWENGDYGHVAYVEKVAGNVIYITEANLGSTTYTEGYLDTSTGKYTNTYGNLGYKTWNGRGAPIGYIHLTDNSSTTIPEGIYYIRSALSNDYVLGVAGASASWGANVQLENSNNTTSQQFQIVSYDGKYAIKNVNSGCALDVVNASSDSGTNVQQYYYWPDQTAAQRWFFEDCGDGYYYIRSELGTYLDVQSGVAANGQNVWVYTGNGSVAQKFRLELAAPIISTASTIYKTGDKVIVEFGAWNGASSFEYYLAEYPEAFAYTTNTKHEKLSWNSVTFIGLPSGHYSVFVHAANDISTSGQSNWLSFDVFDEDYIPVTCKSYNGHIYAVYDYEMSWTFARDLCAAMGGHLITINNSDESAFVNDLIASGKKDAYWIGASNYSSSASNQDGKWSWVTGESFSYTNWNSGEPSASGSEGAREHWAELRKSYSYQWNDVNNTNKANKGFIIEIEPADSDIRDRQFFNGNEYILIDRNTTWTEAKVYCELLGGHLVCVNNNDEEAFLDAFISSGNRNWYYVGASRQGDTWYWLDNTIATGIDWNGDLWPSYCNYLMKYKVSNKYINLPNTYYPENDISKIGFICEIEHETTYTITYDANGGTGAPDAQTKTHDTALTLSNAKPERQYYIFLGWAKTSTATTAAYKPGDSYSDNADAILYAVWYKIECSAPGAAVLLKYGYPLEASTVLKQIIGIG